MNSLKKQEHHREKKLAWKPILSGGLCDAAWDSIHEINKDLNRYRTRNASLVSGNAGLAIFDAYLQSAAGYSDFVRATRLLERALDALSSAHMHASFYSGFTGVIWSMLHLSGQFDVGSQIDASEIDELIFRYVKTKPWRRDYDLIGGLVGLGVYALERFPAPVAKQCLEQIVDRLSELAIRSDGGLTWHTSPDLLPEWQRKLANDGYYNLGLAHGIPGIIALLARLLPVRIKQNQVRSLLNGAIRWLLAQKLPETENSCFSAWLGRGLQPEASRAAWCYGDPGVAIALLSAARSAAEPDWEKQALNIARAVATRRPDQARVVDPGICHGAAGLAHIFNRLYQTTDTEIFRKAAKYWYRKTIEYRGVAKGYGGFASYFPGLKGKPYWRRDPGLLTGSAGIGLCLLAAVSDQEPKWDRFLLTDIH